MLYNLDMETLFMGSIVFFTGFTLLSYILIVLNIPFLIIPISIVAAYLNFKPIKKLLKKIKIKFDKKTIVTLVIFVLGIAGQLAIIAPSGTLDKSGNLLFWSAHGHDGPWHIALMEEMKKGYPFQNPIYAGERLVNYHFFSDVAPAIVSKYLPISNFNLYFRIFPFIYSLFLGISAYYLTKLLTKSHKAALWATIFTYFAGSWGYLIGKGESVFWATQPQSSSGNPPQIISNFLFLTAIYYVLLYIREKNKRKKKNLFLLSVILAGTISAFKIYAGVVLLCSMGLTSLWRLVKYKKADLFLLTFVSGVLALILYFPNSSNSTSFLIFQPWWYVRTMIVEPSRLNLLDWELRRQTYIYEHNWKRVIFLEGLGFLIFFFGNLGMRFLGLWEVLKTKKIIIFSIVLSLVFPLLFLQKGVASNTAQFLQYFVLLFGILAGIQASKITSKYKVLTPVIFLLMIPTQLNLLKDFYFTNNYTARPAFAKISSDEIEALNFIKAHTDENDVILTPPYNQYLDLKDRIPNIWDWFDTAYVSSIASRRSYFDDYEQIDIMGYDKETRYDLKKIVFESKDKNEVEKNLELINADILYFPKALKPEISPESLGLVKIFENSSVEIWKIN